VLPKGGWQRKSPGKAGALETSSSVMMPRSSYRNLLSRLTSVPPAEASAGLTGHGVILCQRIGLGYQRLSYSSVGECLQRSAGQEANAEVFLEISNCRSVIPAKAGIHASHWRWIPAFAGMTT
jgi:hypothetical protein